MRPFQGTIQRLSDLFAQLPVLGQWGLVLWLLGMAAAAIVLGFVSERPTVREHRSDPEPELPGGFGAGLTAVVERVPSDFGGIGPARGGLDDQRDLIRNLAEGACYDFWERAGGRPEITVASAPSVHRLVWVITARYSSLLDWRLRREITNAIEEAVGRHFPWHRVDEKDCCED